MKNIARFFIDNNKFTLVLSLGLLIYGIQGLTRMNSESYPQVDFAIATVTTVYRGASADDIETKITKPIEDEIRTVSGIKDVKSISQPGLSKIVIRADIDNIDVPTVMNDLQKAIDRTNGLPIDLEEKPLFTEIKSEEFPVVEIAVTGSNENRQRDIIADALSEEIEDNKDVKDARLVGFYDREFTINLDYKKLQENHIGVSEVIQNIQSRNVNIPGGTLEEDTNQLLVRLEGKVQTIEDLRNLVIRTNFSGKKVLLKDVAEVVDGKKDIKVKTRYNSKDATLIIVSKKGGADTIKMVKDIQSKIEIFRKNYGDKFQFSVYNDEAIKVKKKLDVLNSNAVSGLVLVVIFLFFFLPGKIGLAASLSLPLAVMGTLGMMPAFGMNLNAITILALVIALGMLVDNSVVISENFTRLQKEGQSKLEAALNSVGSLWLPISATAFTTIAAFLPMLVTKGIMGQFIKWIPIVVSLSLIFSLLESFFFLPMRLVIFGGEVKSDESEKTSDWFQKFEEKFESFMSWCVQKRYLIGGVFTFILFFSIFLITKANKFILFPAEQTEMYIARIETPKGSTLDYSHQTIEKLSKDIKEKLGTSAKHIIARSGTAQVRPDDPKAKDGNNFAMAQVFVDDYTKNNIPHTEILKKLRTIDYSKYASNVEFEAMVNGPPVGNAIEATFRSNNKKDLLFVINSIKDELAKVDGVVDLRIDDVVGDDEVFINIDYEKANRLNLNVKMIGDSVRAAMSGIDVSEVTLQNKDVNLHLRFKERFRKNIEDLKKLTILDRAGNLVPLGSVAEFTTQPGTPHIKRYDFKRSKTLLGNIDEEKITAVIANKKLNDIFQKYQKDYSSVSLKFGGVAESTNESLSSLKDALVLSLIGIFALLVFLFRSYIRPAIIMTTIPLGLLGFGVAFFLHQRPVSFLALIGIIGLGGIIVNSGIVLISFIDQLRDEGELSLNEILSKASRLRLRAVVVTSLTTISGLIPTAYGIGGSDAMLIPMTLAMAWGLTSGTILTLVWVPCAYAITEDLDIFLKKFFKRKNNVEQHSVEIATSRGAK